MKMSAKNIRKAFINYRMGDVKRDMLLIFLSFLGLVGCILNMYFEAH